MKASAKGLVSSSPGRAEKLPAPPLVRLLRGKGGSRSRGRLSSSHSHPRSSPMFVVTRRRSGAEIQEEKEPTSPKVTCIGQVRISSNKKPTSSSSSSKPSSKQQQKEQHRCHCLQRALLCNPFSRKPKSGAGRPLWRRWMVASSTSSYSSRGYRLRREEEPSPPARKANVGKAGSDRGEVDGKDPEDDGEGAEEEELEENRVFVPTTPPKNALLLMRCRSAPHRAPSLTTTRFCGAAAAAATTESNGRAECINLNREQERGKGEESEPGSSVADEENGEEGREGSGEDAALGSELGPSPSFSSQPLILTRCNSEPARKAAKLAPPEASYCFWNHPTTSVAATAIINSSKIKNKSWFPLVEEPCPDQNFQE